MRVALSILFLAFLPAPGRAAPAACPGAEAFLAKDAPFCPEAGSLLEDRYPLMALTISDDVAGTAAVLATANEVFAAQPHPLPLLFVNTDAAGFARLQAEALKRADFTPAMRERLRPVYAESEDDFGIRDSFRHAWQQDFIKGSFDPATGKPRSRLVPTYDQIGNLAEATQTSLAACGIAAGDPLPAPTKQNGYSGGNFDAGPAGTCVLGKSDLSPEAWARYASGVCGSREALVAPSEFTASTHADEIFKMIPLPGGGACDYALAFASPRRAQQLLALYPEEDAFHPGAYKPADFERLLARQPGLGGACATYQEQELKQNRTYKLEPIEWKTAAGLRILAPASNSYISGIDVKCTGLKNKRLLKVVSNDPAFAQGNALAQAKLDKFKEEVRALFKRRAPQCGEPRLIDLPTLYNPRLVVEKSGPRLGTLAEGASSVAVFPTPTNAVLIGRTILLPDPYSRAMERDTRAQLESLGLRVRFVETLPSHALLGNLHCTTQTFRYCKPRPR